jgi:hypothetical protein
MSATDLLHYTDKRDSLQLQPGPQWDSFEQLRLGGPVQLTTELKPDQVGRLRIKSEEFVIMRVQTFNRLLGLASAAKQLSRNLILVRQAVRLIACATERDLAIDHLRDLVFQIPDLVGRPMMKLQDLIFDQGENAEETADADFELDPAKVQRPVFNR